MFINYISIFFIVSLLLTISIPFLQVLAQVPAEEFVIDRTCSNSVIEPIEDKNPNTIENKYIIYDNSTLGFRIEYPSDWKRVEEHCLQQAQGFFQSASIINFQFTPQSKSQGNLGISVTDYTINEPIEKSMDTFSNALGKYIESKKVIMFNGKPATKVIINVNNIQLVQISTFSDERKYDITYPITSGFSNSTLQHMLDTFEMTNSQASDSKENEGLSESNELG
jgi:hypothetical protein